MRRIDGEATLTLRSFADIDDGVLLARLYPTPDQPVDIPLMAEAPREFTGRLPQLPGGRYPLTVTTRSNGRDVNQRTELVEVPATDEDPQEEFEAEQPNVALLKTLAQATGGAFNAPVRELVGRALGSRRVDHPLEWLFIPLAMVLFLADIAGRRLGGHAASSAERR